MATKEQFIDALGKALQEIGMSYSDFDLLSSPITVIQENQEPFVFAFAPFINSSDEVVGVVIKYNHEGALCTINTSMPGDLKSEVPDVVMDIPVTLQEMFKAT